MVNILIYMLLGKMRVNSVDGELCGEYTHSATRERHACLVVLTRIYHAHNDGQSTILVVNDGKRQFDVLANAAVRFYVIDPRDMS